MNTLKKSSRLLTMLLVNLSLGLGLTTPVPARAALQSVPMSPSWFDGVDNDAAAVAAVGAAALGAAYLVGKTIHNRYWTIAPIEKDLKDSTVGPIKHMWNWREQTLPTAEDIWRARDGICRDLIGAIKHGEVTVQQPLNGRVVNSAFIIAALNDEMAILRRHANQLDSMIGYWWGYSDTYKNACANTAVVHDRDSGALNLLTKAQSQTIDGGMCNEYVGWLNPYGLLHWNYNYAVHVRWQVEKALRRLYALRNVFERYDQPVVFHQVAPALYQANQQIAGVMRVEEID